MEEGSTCLTYTGLCEGLEHLKIETKLINERFTSEMGECVILTSQVFRRFTSFIFKISRHLVYYESRKREVKTRPIYECRCDERLKTKSEKSTRLT